MSISFFSAILKLFKKKEGAEKSYFFGKLIFLDKIFKSCFLVFFGNEIVEYMHFFNFYFN